MRSIINHVHNHQETHVRNMGGSLCNSNSCSPTSAVPLQPSVYYCWDQDVVENWRTKPASTSLKQLFLFGASVSLFFAAFIHFPEWLKVKPRKPNVGHKKRK
ncbi:unnamed protein product [Arctogadus glacialis]